MQQTRPAIRHPTVCLNQGPYLWHSDFPKVKDFIKDSRLKMESSNKTQHRAFL